MPRDRLKVVIVGAGIGGLRCAPRPHGGVGRGREGLRAGQLAEAAGADLTPPGV